MPEPSGFDENQIEKALLEIGFPTDLHVVIGAVFVFKGVAEDWPSNQQARVGRVISLDFYFLGDKPVSVELKGGCDEDGKPLIFNYHSDAGDRQWEYAYQPEFSGQEQKGHKIYKGKLVLVGV